MNAMIEALHTHLTVYILTCATHLLLRVLHSHLTINNALNTVILADRL